MNKDMFESQWAQIKTFLRDKWPNLTDEDLRLINGRYDQLIARLQQRYGYTKEEAEDQLRRWVIDRPKAFTPREEEAHRSDSSSLLKWLLLAGIPLALLATYLSHENTKVAEEKAVNAPVSENVMVIKTPNDQVVIQEVRSALGRSALITRGADTVRIDSVGGVVTITGTVATAQEKDAVGKLVQNINGVKSVNNQLEVR
jgi:uncharacterized protein YjbJ (UPF0337 family)